MHIVCQPVVCTFEWIKSLENEALRAKVDNEFPDSIKRFVPNELAHFFVLGAIRHPTGDCRSLILKPAASICYLNEPREIEVENCDQYPESDRGESAR